ncbi:glutathione S-transferase N-terminal domain-containing protein [Pseudomonas sp. QE6]|uniref:glutathione S-transferase N-terminal domain-containing protein n=1 Tax=Pseudomonas sp. QE6 TaxID=3242491 RepID=UPI0035299B48
MLEALGVPYRIRRINLALGEQHQPDFARLTPHGKIPLLVDHEQELTLPESGAILQYLAETHLRFLPTAGPERYVEAHGRESTAEQKFFRDAWRCASLAPERGSGTDRRAVRQHTFRFVLKCSASSAEKMGVGKNPDHGAQENETSHNRPGCRSNLRRTGLCLRRQHHQLQW